MIPTWRVELLNGTSEQLFWRQNIDFPDSGDSRRLLLKISYSDLGVLLTSPCLRENHQSDIAYAPLGVFDDYM